MTESKEQHKLRTFFLKMETKDSTETKSLVESTHEIHKINQTNDPSKRKYGVEEHNQMVLHNLKNSEGTPKSVRKKLDEAIDEAAYEEEARSKSRNRRGAITLTPTS